ncbi:MAG: DUF429 domain-containing protein [Chromatiaceae bacterium]
MSGGRTEVLGIDGCRGGWVWVACREDRWEYGVVPRLAELTARIKGSALAFVELARDTDSEDGRI